MNSRTCPLFCLLCVLFLAPRLFAQGEDPTEMAEEVQPEGWVSGVSLGLDLGQLLQFNPRVGAGENRVGVGTNLAVFARFKRGKLNWDNTASYNLAVQRLGGGILPGGGNVRVPWQKSIDELRLSSLVGNAFTDDGVWGYGAEATFLTQITKTFQDAGGRNLLKSVDSTNGGLPIAELLSSATFTLSPGVTYRPDEHFDALFSPLSYKSIFVADEELRALPLYDYLDENNDGERVLSQLGASLRANYQNTYLADDRLLLKTSVGLFSNYLRDPQNVDIDWRTEIGYEIVSGLKISLQTIVLYDDNVLVQITDYDQVGGFERNANGTPRLGKRISLTEQLLVTYAVVF